MAVVVPLWAAMCAGGTAAAAAVLALSPRRSPARPEEPVLAEEEAPPSPDAPESDNESDGSADERDGAADEGDHRGRKGMKRFSIDERWLQRCSRLKPGRSLRANAFARSDDSTAAGESAPSVTLPPTSLHAIAWCGDTPVL